VGAASKKKKATTLYSRSMKQGKMTKKKEVIVLGSGVRNLTEKKEGIVMTSVTRSKDNTERRFRGPRLCEQTQNEGQVRRVTRNHRS